MISKEDIVTLQEKVARIICASRGADPDQPITIGYPADEENPNGRQKLFETAWEGYTDLADEIIAAVKAEKA